MIIFVDDDMVEEDELDDTTMFWTPFVIDMPTLDEIDTSNVKLEDDYVHSDCEEI